MISDHQVLLLQSNIETLPSITRLHSTLAFLKNNSRHHQPRLINRDLLWPAYLTKVLSVRFFVRPITISAFITIVSALKMSTGQMANLKIVGR